MEVVDAEARADCATWEGETLGGGYMTQCQIQQCIMKGYTSRAYGAFDDLVQFVVHRCDALCHGGCFEEASL